MNNIIMPVYNIHQGLFAKRQSKCKGRKNKQCKTAKKKCLWARGTKRSFCRKKKSTRKSTRKSTTRRP